MANPLPPPVSEIAFEQITLERIKVAARAYLSPQVAHDLRLRVERDVMTDRMLLHLRAHVYAHKVDRQDVEVPFERSETLHVAGPRWLLTTSATVIALGVALCAVFASWPALAVAMAAAMAAVVVHAANPAHDRTVTAKGVAVVRREQFNTFPDNQMVYPDSLGAPVQIATMDQWPRYYEAP